MIPDEGYTSYKGKPCRNEDPEEKLVPVHVLYFVEAIRIDQLPGSKDVHFMRPDRAHVVETADNIEEKKKFGSHETKGSRITLPSEIVAHMLIDSKGWNSNFTLGASPASSPA